jgi:hypothetical protein
MGALVVVALRHLQPTEPSERFARPQILAVRPDSTAVRRSMKVSTMFFQFFLEARHSLRSTLARCSTRRAGK